METDSKNAIHVFQKYFSQSLRSKSITDQSQVCSIGVSASNGESLVIGLNFILPPVLTSTTVTSPVLDTLPRSVRPSNLALVCLAQTLRQHLLRDYLLVETIWDGIQFSVGKYSRIKRFHTLRITSSTQSFCFQLLKESKIIISNF